MLLKLLKIDSDSDRAALDAMVDRLRDCLAGNSQTAQIVAAIVDDVKENGDEALVKYMRKFTNPDAQISDIQVDQNQISDAYQQMDNSLKDAFARAIDHVRTYQQHIKPKDPKPITIDDAELGLRFTPIRRVGLSVPGGKANYPSTVIMSGVPAQVAGVEQMAVCCPPPNIQTDQKTTGNSDVSPLVLGVCHMLGITEVYRVGGAEAVAAMAYGTQTIKPVDLITGPGTFSQQAKRQVYGTVGIDGLLGPSEIVVYADESANPKWIAADLIAQAEHDPGCCFLVSTDKKVINNICTEVETQLATCNRKQALEKALRQWSAAVLVNDEAQAIDVIDFIAAEHVTLAVADPKVTLGKLRNGGAWFLADSSPVASGDYYAGPSHCLPTGTTARFTSGVSVYTFLKRSSVEYYPTGLTQQATEDIIQISEAEGLDGHANSVRVRDSK